MSDVFVGDNDHGNRVPSSEVLLQMIKQLRAERDETRLRIKPLTIGEKIAMTITNDSAPINDASTLVARLEEHSDFANKVIRDLLREASDRIQILTKERDFYEMKMTFYAKDVEREADEAFWLKERHSQ